MKRSKYNLSNYRLLTAEMGKLYPVQLQEILPGDTLQVSSSAFIRFSPMLAPVLHPITIRLHHWFVPNRILWDGWEDFITGGPDNDNTDLVPYFHMQDETCNDLVDYLGFPVDNVNNARCNSLPIRAYNKIWNEFYRDQDLQDEVDEDQTCIQHVSWQKDYFTTARPFPQKGPDIVLPLGDKAYLSGLGTGYDYNWNDNTPTIFLEAFENEQYQSWGDPQGGTNPADRGPIVRGVIREGEQVRRPDVYADLSQATGISVTQLRDYFAQQRWAEARAQFGSRYTEYLRFLGVKSSDARLQRPEYVGGGKSTASISEVLQTGTDDSTPVGTLRGHGIGAVKTRRSRKFMEEHGYLLTLMSVVPKNIYVNGADRHFMKTDREEYWQREFEHIGQQAIWDGEIRMQASGDPAVNKATFGYSDRYGEYHSARSRVTGEFRDLLNYWHLGRNFGETQPALNEDFIQCRPTKRIFAEQTQDPLWIAVNNSTVARRLVNRTTIGRVK